MSSDTSFSFTNAEDYFRHTASQEELLVPHCTSCGKAHWYPRRLCPFCLSSDLEFKPSKGRGTIHAHTVMRRVPEPYALAYVELAEGPKMMTNIVDSDLDHVRIGQEVQLKFKHIGETAVPVFQVKPK